MKYYTKFICAILHLVVVVVVVVVVQFQSL